MSRKECVIHGVQEYIGIDDNLRKPNAHCMVCNCDHLPLSTLVCEKLLMFLTKKVL